MWLSHESPFGSPIYCTPLLLPPSLHKKLLYFHPNFKGTTPLNKCTSERRRLCLSYWKCKEKHNVTNVYLLPDYNALMSTQSYGCTEQNDWLVQQNTDETYRWLACVNYYEGEWQRAQLTSQLQHRYPTQRSVARVWSWNSWHTHSLVPTIAGPLGDQTLPSWCAVHPGRREGLRQGTVEARPSGLCWDAWDQEDLQPIPSCCDTVMILRIPSHVVQFKARIYYTSAYQVYRQSLKQPVRKGTYVDFIPLSHKML